MNPGQLYILSAPSGAGKTSLLKALCERLERTLVSVSHTTRPPRPGEVDGTHYHFCSVPAFRQALEQGAFLEYAEVFGNYYGTSRPVLERQLADGYDVILEIDWQGAQQVREVLDRVPGIFILPPGMDALEARLRARAQDDEAVIRKRMLAACSEMSHFGEYDYLIVNEHFETALDELLAIFRSGRLRLEVQRQRHVQLLTTIGAVCD